MEKVRGKGLATLQIKPAVVLQNSLIYSQEKNVYQAGFIIIDTGYTNKS